MGNMGMAENEYHEKMQRLAEQRDHPGTDLVPLPDGQLVDLSNPTEVALRLDDLRTLEARVREAKTLLVDAIAERSRIEGTKTLHLPGNVVVEVKGGEKVFWDAQRLEQDLRDLGMPEERLREVIVEEISYTVSSVKAKQASRANPEYAKAVEAARHVVETRPTVTVKRS